MSRVYEYKKPLKRRRGAGLKRLAGGLVVICLAIVPGIFYAYRHNNSLAQAVLSAQTGTDDGPTKTVSSNYFSFQDKGDWVPDEQNSSPDKAVYVKNSGSQTDTLIIYVNKEPVSLDLAATRVLPVKIDNNSLKPGAVSANCDQTDGPNRVKMVREATIDNITMLCAPHSSGYSVVVGQSGGDYHLVLKRPNGQPEQFVITYKTNSATPKADSITNIASSFIAR